MLKNSHLISVLSFVTVIGFLIAGGCATDPIKGVKNNPMNMDIIMNHIATDDTFREQMVEKLTTRGDRMKLAEKLVADEDFGKILMSRLLETKWGEDDLITRAAGQENRLRRTIRKALTNFENRQAILDVILADKEMVEFLQKSDRLKETLAED